MSKPNRVYVRSYCECDCDCPNCHDGGGKVEDCVYCQLKWAGRGQYNPKYRKEQGWSPPEEYKPKKLEKSDDDVLEEIIEWWKEQS